MKATSRDSPLTNLTGSAIGSGTPGQSGEGFYQGLVGRKTGRPAPLPMGHGRSIPRHESLLATHGLIDQGAADQRQGQLFVPPVNPVQHGMAPPLASSRPGYMPELYEKEGGGHVTTKQAHKRMVGAVNRLSNFGLTSAQALENRAATRSRHLGEAPWYAERTPHSPENPNQGRFDLGPGSATKMINTAAQREGVSYDEMSRATAITSARTRWTGGTPGTDDFSAPNLESARNVVRDVKVAKSVADDLDVQVDYADVGRHARSEGALQDQMAKAGADFAVGDPFRPVPIANLYSQKVPNFNQSLQLANPSQAVRRQAAMSYTVDTHDVSAMGAHPDLLKTSGGMAIARMTGRRSALRHGELPPMHQSATWEGQKSKEVEPLGKNSLLETMRSGKIRTRPEQEAGHISPQFDNVDRRSPHAKKLGIEF